MSKCLLHKDKLQAFKDWLGSKGMHYREGIGAYQVLQVFQHGQWMGIFKRDNMIEHLTVDVRLEGLVRAFINTSKSKYSSDDLENIIRNLEESICFQSGIDVDTRDSRVLLEMLKHLGELNAKSFKQV